MNKPFLALFKVTLKQSFDFRKNNKKNIAFIVPILCIVLLGCFFSSIYAYLFSYMLKEANVSLNVVLYAMAGFATMLILTTTVPKVKNILFGGQDYEMLSALPIKKSSIIAVKFLGLYLVELLFSFVFIVPSTIIVVVLGSSPLLLIEGLLLFLFIPILPLILAGIVGMSIALISDHFKFGNILTVFFYLIFLCAVMYLSFSMSNANATEDMTDIITTFQVFSWFNPTIQLLLIDLPVVNYLIFFAVNLSLFGLMAITLGYCYDYFHVLMTSTKCHRTYLAKPVKQKGVFKAIFTLDLKRYFSSKAYLLNTMTGGILTIVMTIFMVVVFLRIDDPEAMIVLRERVAPYLPIMILWCASIAVPSSVCINMEGKGMWQVKCLPLDYRKYALSKILLSELITAPTALIASIILLFYMEITPIYVITTLLLPQVYLLAMNCLAFYVNMCFPNLKWSNEIKAVKNSMSAVLSMLIDFAGSLIVAAVFLLLGVYVDVWVGAITVLGLSLIFAIFGVCLVYYKCEKKISFLEI